MPEGDGPGQDIEIRPDLKMRVRRDLGVKLTHAGPGGVGAGAGEA